MPSPELLASLHMTYLTSLLRVASHSHFKKERLKTNNFCTKACRFQRQPFLFQITQTIEQIELLDCQLGNVEDQIRKITLSLDSVIITIPGKSLLEIEMILDDVVKNNCTFKTYYDSKVSQG